MKRLLLIGTIAAACVVTVFTPHTAAAMYVAGSELSSAADELSDVSSAQYVYGGRRYCWYDDGWNGPGFYVCGQYLTRGIGWGGAAGWRGWRGGAVYRGGVARGGAVYRGGRAGVHRGGAAHFRGGAARGGRVGAGGRGGFRGRR